MTGQDVGNTNSSIIKPEIKKNEENESPGPNALNKTQDIERNLDKVKIQSQISKYIGQGEDAKNSVVWTTIQYSFFIGGGFSICAYIGELIHYALKQNDPYQFPIEEIRSIWEIFVPLITLSIGYMFGKTSNED